MAVETKAKLTNTYQPFAQPIPDLENSLGHKETLNEFVSGVRIRVISIRPRTRSARNNLSVLDRVPVASVRYLSLRETRTRTRQLEP